MLRRLALTALLLGAFLQTGCALRTIHLNASTGECLNPLGGYCDEYGSNSVVLSLQVYQLKREVVIEDLDWEAFLTEGEDIKLLEAFLTDPEDIAVVRKRFALSTSVIERDLRLKRRLRTRYLLLVAAGRERGDLSIAQIRVPWGYRGRKICLEYYDVAALKWRRDDCTFTFKAVPMPVTPPVEEEP